MATEPAPNRVVRISHIAGRYLVFDLQDVVHLRRQHNICAVFVGTMPQNPTQNIFMGLPVELLAEEVNVLVNKGAAYIADDAVEHLARLSAMDDTSRKAYLQSLKTQRKKAHAALEEEKLARTAQARANRLSNGKSPRKAGKDQASPEAVMTQNGPLDPASSAEPTTTTAAPNTNTSTTLATTAPGITPGTSAELVDGATGLTGPRALDDAKPCPLYAHLNSKGYFITPGLRFGGDYSVYPGDPFRYHAHFMATNYGWEEEITMLDLVASGRLGTAVKKGYMLAGQKPRTDGDGSKDLIDGGEVRAFCMEWAGM